MAVMGIKKCVIKPKLKFEDYKSCLKVKQLQNEINHPEKNNIEVDSPRKYHQEYLKDNTTKI